MDDLQVKQFIEKCLVPASMRLHAVELLKDPFLATENLKELNCEPSHKLNVMHKLVNSQQPECRPMDIDSNCKKLSSGSCKNHIIEASTRSSLELQKFTENNEFRLQGGKNGDNTISLSLRIANPFGKYSCKTKDSLFLPLLYFYLFAHDQMLINILNMF